MIKIKKIKPMFTSIVTTMEKYNTDVLTEGGIIDPTKTKSGIKEYQTVVAIGDSVRSVKIGDLVCVNPARFAVKKHQEGSLKDGIVCDNPIMQYNFDTILLDSVPHLLLQDRDIEFIIEDYEIEKEQIVASKIILPKPKKIVS